MNPLIKNLLLRPTDALPVQFVRYFLVGGVAFGVDIGTLALLTETAGVHYLMAASLGFLAGLVVNYLLSTQWIFRTSALRNRTLEFGLFAAIGIVGLLLNDGLIAGLVEVGGMHYAWAKIVAAGVVFLWNFGARKYLLFTRWKIGKKA